MSVNPEEIIAKARAALDLGAPGSALELLQPAMAAYPAMPILWLLAGEAYDNLEQQELAAEAFAKAAELNPECAVAFSQLAFCLVDLRRLTEAEQAARKSIALKPSGPRYSILGVILRNLGRDDDAIEAYRRSLELDPSNDEVIVNLAIAMHLRGDDLAASRLLERAVRDYPDNAAAHRELGFIRMREGNLESAESLLIRSTQLNASDEWTAIYLANAYWRNGKRDAAEREYLRACALRPDAAYPRYWYGEFLWKQDKTDQAEAVYRDAIRVDQEDALACWHLGRCLMSVGKGEEGRHWLTRALELSPNHLYADNIREYLVGNQPDQ